MKREEDDRENRIFCGRNYGYRLAVGFPDQARVPVYAEDLSDFGWYDGLSCLCYFRLDHNALYAPPLRDIAKLRRKLEM